MKIIRNAICACVVLTALSTTVFATAENHNTTRSNKTMQIAVDVTETGTDGTEGESHSLEFRIRSDKKGKVYFFDKVVGTLTIDKDWKTIIKIGGVTITGESSEEDLDNFEGTISGTIKNSDGKTNTTIEGTFTAEATNELQK